jgi:hypothetical protein
MNSSAQMIACWGLVQQPQSPAPSKGQPTGAPYKQEQGQTATATLSRLLCSLHPQTLYARPCPCPRPGPRPSPPYPATRPCRALCLALLTLSAQPSWYDAFCRPLSAVYRKHLSMSRSSRLPRRCAHSSISSDNVGGRGCSAPTSASASPCMHALWH